MRRLIHEEHHVVETFGADSHDPQIDGEPVAGANLPDKIGVVFEIHGPRFAATVAGVAEPDSRIEFVSRVIEDSDIMPDVHVLVAVRPVDARDRFVTGRPQFPNLF